LAVPILVSVAIRTRDREAGYGRRLASSRFPLVLDLEGSPRKSWTTGRSKGHTRTDPNHEASLAKYMVRHSKPPSPTWRTFLANHVSQMVSVDFFTVHTIWFETLFVFVVLAHNRRRILHFK
jgi:hypothetical protein